MPVVGANVGAAVVTTVCVVPRSVATSVGVGSVGSPLAPYKTFSKLERPAAVAFVESIVINAAFLRPPGIGTPVVVNDS